MLNLLKFVENIGQFVSVTDGARLPLKEMTLGYAENGRGKTTLSAIFRSLATNDPLPINERRRLGSTSLPRIVIECVGAASPAIFQNGAWTRHLPNVVIFDDAFVDENICSGLAIGSENRQNLHELILGVQGVTLNQALQNHIDTIETLTRSLRNLGNAIPETARFGVPVEDFCALPDHPQIDEAIRGVERAIAAAGEQDAIRSTPIFDRFTLPSLNEEALASLLADGIEAVDQTDTEKVQAHCDAIGAGGEGWVADGIKRVPGGIEHPEGKPCPFCAQDLGASSLVGHYRAYFATAYAAHKQAIEQVSEEFYRRFGSDAQMFYDHERDVVEKRRQFWSRFTDIPDVAYDTDGIYDAWTKMREAVQSVLDAKAAAPLERVAFDERAQSAIADYNAKIAAVLELTERLLQINPAIELVKERAASANIPALRADLERLSATKFRYSPEIVPLCTNFINERDRKIAAESARDAARVALDNYRTNIFPEYQSAINDCLSRFNAGFHLDRVTSQNTRGGSACTYNVLINN